jgi:hypothetical protein
MSSLIDAFRKVRAAVAAPRREPPPSIHPEVLRHIERIRQATTYAEIRRVFADFKLALAMLDRQREFQREMAARLSKFVAEYNARACPALRRRPPSPGGAKAQENNCSLRG